MYIKTDISLKKTIIFFILSALPLWLLAQPYAGNLQRVRVDSGWAKNSVNAVIFRKNSLTSVNGVQFIAFYNNEGKVVLGKRKLTDTAWQLTTTRFRGNAKDAHNSISIMADGAGYLHLAWDHHGNKLHYTRSQTPYSLDMADEMPMTGQFERNVTYPEFFRLPDGNLIFMYRDGGSGLGNLVLNYFHTTNREWSLIHSNLISGESKRNAYWQAVTDSKGHIHLSWVWRESPDVATNHDMAYARSTDGGKTWQKSTGETYSLPITASTAEYIARIPQKSELINQTSMAVDQEDNPYIATYWRNATDSVPQYRVIALKQGSWQVMHTGFRKKGFSLSGSGSKYIPVSRPQILVKGSGSKTRVLILFRDGERGEKASYALWKGRKWQTGDLHPLSLGAWEPSYDTNLWQSQGVLHLFAQPVVQVDGEGLSSQAPTMVEVWQWKPAL